MIYFSFVSPRRFCVLLACLAAFVLLFPAPSSAQPAETTEKTAQERLAESGIDFKKIPKPYMREAKAAYNNCKGNINTRAYYDCKCLAFEHLLERIEAGPDLGSSTISFRIQDRCRDATEAAGVEYDSCLREYATLPPGTDPQAFCNCYANTFSKMIDARAPMLQSKTIVPLKVRARVTCSDPALARKLYNSRY